MTKKNILTISLVLLACIPLIAQEVTISNYSSPAETEKGQEFSSAFSVTYLYSNTKEPVEKQAVQVTYPVSAQNGEYLFEEKTLYTNKDGTVFFMPENTNFTCNSEISFSSLGLPISFPFKIYTDLRRAGTSIAITDTDKNGNPLIETRTSSLVLRYLLKNSGFSNTGNADLPLAVLSDDAERVQKEAQAMFQNNVTTLLYGVASHTTETTADGVSVTLTVPLRARLLKSDTEVFRKTFVVTKTHQSEGHALTAARDEIAQIIAENIKYGL